MNYSFDGIDNLANVLKEAEQHSYYKIQWIC